MDKTHEEFMEDVAEASSLPAQTCRALGPESDKDVAMYLQEHDNLTGNAKKELDGLIKHDVEHEKDEVNKDGN
jgi:hypothetical protein